MPPAATISPLWACRPPRCGPVALGTAAARARESPTREGRGSLPLPLLERARNQPPHPHATPHQQTSTPSCTPTLIPGNARRTACASWPALRSPLRGFAEMFYKGSPLFLHRSTSGPAEPQPPSRKGNSVPSSRKRNPSPMPPSSATMPERPAIHAIVPSRYAP